MENQKQDMQTVVSNDTLEESFELDMRVEAVESTESDTQFSIARTLTTCRIC